MAGFQNDVLIAKNVDFTGVQPTSGKVTVNSQLLIGSTVAPNIRVGALTSTGGTVVITTGAGTINLEALGSVHPWNEVAVPTNAVAYNGYFVTAATTITLPVGVLGNDIQIVDLGAGGGVIIQAQAGDIISIGNVSSSAGGTATSTSDGDAIRMIYNLTTNRWVSVPGSQGIWNLA